MAGITLCRGESTNRKTMNKIFILAISFVLFSSSMLVGVSGQTMILSELTEVTSSSSPGQQFDQCAISHDGLLHLFWASISIDAAWGQDSDIIHATFDGDVWSEPEVLTPDDNGNDYTPFPIVFDGDLYIFWQTDEFTLTGGNHSDIIYRVHDGNGWGPTIDVTKDLNDNDEYNPSALVFDGSLYLFFEWFSSESITEEIGVSTFDGTSWSSMTRITEASNGLNVNPKAAALHDELVLVWETYDTAYAGNEGGSAVVATTFNGIAWSSTISILGAHSGLNTHPYPCLFENKVCVAWSSTSTSFSSGQDSDIVVRLYSGGTWSDNVTELTPDDIGDDVAPVALANEGTLYLAWVTDDTGISAGTDTDIVLRLFDGHEWTLPVEMSVDDGERPDGGGMTYKVPSLAFYDDRIQVIWETNASPHIGAAQPTWLVMAELTQSDNYDTDNDTILILLAGLLVVGIVAGAYVYYKHRKGR